VRRRVRETNGCDWIVGALGHYGFLNAVLLAGVSSRVAVADGGPGPIDAGTAAREEQVVLGDAIVGSAPE
jgi:hypothetical protein